MLANGISHRYVDSVKFVEAPGRIANNDIRYKEGPHVFMNLYLEKRNAGIKKLAVMLHCLRMCHSDEQLFLTRIFLKVSVPFLRSLSEICSEEL